MSSSWSVVTSSPVRIPMFFYAMFSVEINYLFNSIFKICNDAGVTKRESITVYKNERLLIFFKRRDLFLAKFTNTENTNDFLAKREGLVIKNSVRFRSPIPGLFFSIPKTNLIVVEIFKLTLLTYPLDDGNFLL